MEPTTADRPLTPTVKIYRDNRSSMSIVPRFATATTQFGGFGLSWTLRISSGMTEGICKWMMQSDREFLNIWVSCGQ